MQKKRKIMLLAIVIVLVVLVIFMNLDTNKSPSSSNVNYSKNEYTVYNQGENILEYGDYAYFVDNYSNSIFRYDKQNSSTVQVAQSKNSIYNKLFVINNNLVFSTNSITYYISLNGDANSGYKKFVDGRVVYMNEDLFLYIKNMDGVNNLYVSSYNSETFSITNKMFYTLAQGYNINFLKQLGDELYFTSANSDGSASLFVVDLKNYKITLVVREFLEDDMVNTYLEFNDVAKIDNEIYYVLSTNELTTATKPNTRYYLYTRNIEYDYKEFVAQDVEPYLYNNPENKDEILYQQYTEYSVEPEWNADTPDWEKIIYGDVTRFFEIDNSKLMLEGAEFVDLDQDYSKYEIESVYRINGAFYVLLSNEDSSYSWYSCNEDGSNLHKII